MAKLYLLDSTNNKRKRSHTVKLCFTNLPTNLHSKIFKLSDFLLFQFYCMLLLISHFVYSACVHKFQDFKVCSLSSC